MVTNVQTMEQIVVKAQQLSLEEQLRLIQRLIETLLPAVQPKQPRLWRYGLFRGENMSSEEDFVMAEWHPTDEELNGP
ncbi:MAG: hypothetical protein AB1791_10365 [Chloroflexota bacterium]